ncbi:MAG: histidine phosphatase family protein [Actinobacteria bacterium]|nr:histidine phosphatase family protein [Actinomycetota bacterium]MBO0814574.1 histidine phosphatase family protein [Actinomycetota bacterium]
MHLSLVDATCGTINRRGRPDRFSLAQCPRWSVQDGAALNAGLRALYSSPLRRARETADLIAAVIGLPVQLDAGLSERMNWDGSGSYEDFAAECCRPATGMTA